MEQRRTDLHLSSRHNPVIFGASDYGRIEPANRRTRERMTWIRVYGVLVVCSAAGCSSIARGPAIAAAQCNVVTKTDVTPPSSSGSSDSASSPEHFDECAEPLTPRDRSTDEEAIDHALGLPPRADELFVLRTQPWGRSEGVLSLRKAREGTYLLRSTRLAAGAWSQMHSSGIDKVLESRTINERLVDQGTAELLLTLAGALLSRKQVAFTSHEQTFKCDGTGYDLLSERGAVSISQPTPGSAFGLAVAGAAQLADLVDFPSAEDCAQLAGAVRKLQAALLRSRGEPCGIATPLSPAP